jgi:hypothetical protein
LDYLGGDLLARKPLRPLILLAFDTRLHVRSRLQPGRLQLRYCELRVTLNLPRFNNSFNHLRVHFIAVKHTLNQLLQAVAVRAEAAMSIEV